MRPHYYIGLATSYHDPAIAILNEKGEVLYAEPSERPHQLKRGIGCAPDTILWTEWIIKKYCVPGADYTITKSWTKKIKRKNKLIHLLGLLRFDLNKRLKNFALRYKGMPVETFYNAIWFFNTQYAMHIHAGMSVEKVIRTQMAPSSIKHIDYDHHFSHTGIACYCSPYDEAVCLVMDGSGEGGSFAIYKYLDGKISLLEKQKSATSLGNYYARLTTICGFDPLKGEEWKVMGLAAYGNYNENLRDLFKLMYSVVDCDLRHSVDSANTFSIVKKLKEIAATAPDSFSIRADLAYNGQLAYCEWMNELITNMHKKYPSDNLILTGGCALNSSHNGHILDKTPFKNLYVPSAPADDGNALGGALLAYYAANPQAVSRHKNLSPYLGTEINEEHLAHLIKFSGCKIRKLEADKYEVVAGLLAAGKIIGWMQGKAEFGPRSLGNRSILADARSSSIKDIINERVKFREEFRPFAPSILHEYGDEYFEHYQESHYMERTLQFKPEVMDKVPGVVHKDGTGRLQTVKEEWNVELYHLLKAYHKETGVPLLLNTSFNIMGKPIIHSVEDAVSTFFTTGLDALVIGDYLIEK